MYSRANTHPTISNNIISDFVSLRIIIYLGSAIRGSEGRIGELGLGTNHQKESILI